MKDDIWITEIPTWAKTANCLYHHKIWGVYQLLSMSDKELLSLKGFGKERLKDVHEMIKEYIIPLIQEVESGKITVEEINKNAHKFE